MRLMYFSGVLKFYKGGPNPECHPPGTVNNATPPLSSVMDLNRECPPSHPPEYCGHSCGHCNCASGGARLAGWTGTHTWSSYQSLNSFSWTVWDLVTKG